MAEDQLIVEGIFDPAGILKGVDLGASALGEFQRLIQRLSAALPGLDKADFLDGVADGARDAAADLRAFETEVKATGGAMQRLAAQPIITRDKVAELKILSAQLVQSGADARQFATNLGGMNTALLAQSRASVLRATDGGRSFQQGLDNIKKANLGVADSFTKSTRAANLMRGGLVTLASQSLGTSSALGQLAQSVLFFGGGAGLVIKLAAVVLGAAFAYDKLTSATRRANEEQKKHTQGLRDAIAAQQDGFKIDLAVSTKRERDLKKEITALRKQSASVGLGGDVIFGPAIEKLQRELVQVSTDVIEGNAIFLAGEEAKRESIKATVREVEIFRNAVRGSGNLTAGMGGTNAGPLTGGLLSGASAEQISDSRGKAWEAAEQAAADYVRAVQDGLDSLLTAEEIHLEWIEQQRDAFRELTDSLFGVAQAAGNVGLIGTNAVNAIGGVLDLADALKKIKLDGASFANVLGGISAGIGIIGSIAPLFGTESAGDRLLKENNDRLAELKLSLDKTLGSPAEIKRLAASASTVAATFPLIPQGAFGEDFEAQKRAIQDFADQLAPTGLTIKEWGERVKQATGIDIFDEKGRLVAGTLAQADKAFQILIADMQADDLAAAQKAAADAIGREADRIRQAFQAAADAAYAIAQAQRAAEPTLLGLKRQLTGTDTPQQQFKDAMAGLDFGGGGFGDVIREAMRGVDLNDPASRAALNAQLLEWVNGLLSGSLVLEDPSMLQPLLDFLGTGTDLLGGFTDAVNEATKSLQNVPSGINLMALEFAAQAAGGPMAPASSSGTGPSSWESSPVGSPTRAVKGGTILTHNGDIIVNTQPGQNARQIALEIVKVQKRESMARVGNPDGRF